MKQTIQAITGVTIQPSPIPPRTRQHIPRPPLIIAIPITAPTTACELDIGTKGIVGKLLEAKIASNPCDAKRNNTIEC